MIYRTRWFFKPILLIIDIFGYILFFWTKLKSMPENPKRILVIRLNHIGDMVLTSSFFRNLKKNYPDAEITVLCRSMTKPVAEMIPYIDKIKVLDSPWFSRGKSESWYEVLKFALKNRKRYDLGFDMHADPRNAILCRMMSKYSIGYGIRGFGFVFSQKPEYEKGVKHIVERNLDLLKSLGLKVDDGKLEIDIPKDALNSVKKKLKSKGIKPGKYILIQMSSGDKEREWPMDYWVREVGKLVKKQKVVTADLDRKKVKILKNSIESGNLIDIKVPLRQYIALISLSRKVISVESMAIHVAATAGVKVVDLHSYQTDPKEWGPYLAKSEILRQSE